MLSAAKSWNYSFFSRAVVSKPIDLSVPIMNKFLFTPKYFPFPQPISTTVEPS